MGKTQSRVWSEFAAKNGVREVRIRNKIGAVGPLESYVQTFTPEPSTRRVTRVQRGSYLQDLQVLPRITSEPKECVDKIVVHHG